jgi:hypothetical protein
MTSVTIRYEQAVYGSFPFWDKGYAVLARSKGCRDEWISDFRVICQRYGEQPVGAAEAGGLLAIKLPSGPWAIIGPCPQGRDDRGRPGATAFHAIFISGSSYRKIGAWPFALTKLLRNDWSSETQTLVDGTVTIDDLPSTHGQTPPDPQACLIAQALLRGRRVVLESNEPIGTLAETVWKALPLPKRARLSLATWTFANGSTLDFLAVPRISSLILDKTYVDGSTLFSDSKHEATADHHSRFLKRLAESIWLGFALVAVLPIGILIRHHVRQPFVPVRTTPQNLIIAADQLPPRVSATAALSSVSRRRVEDAIISLAERFDCLDRVDSTTNLKPYVLLTQIRQRLTYRGTFDTSLPAAFEHLRHFLPDRPLPDDFPDGGLEWQLRVLSWSFHLDPGARSVEELPAFLSESLSLLSPLKLPQASRSAVEIDAAQFLKKLPVR